MYQFPRLSTYNEFCRIFLGTNLPNFPHLMVLAVFFHVMGNQWENTCISHLLKYTIRWEKSTYIMGKVWLLISQTFPIPCDLLHFPILWKIYGGPMHFPYDELYHRMGIEWEKSTHTMGKVWVSIFKTFPIPWVLLHFPILWEIYGESQEFPKWWHWLFFPMKQTFQS